MVTALHQGPVPSVPKHLHLFLGHTPPPLPWWCLLLRHLRDQICLLVALHLGVEGQGLSSGTGPGLASQPLPFSSTWGIFHHTYYVCAVWFYLTLLFRGRVNHEMVPSCLPSGIRRSQLLPAELSLRLTAWQSCCSDEPQSVPAFQDQWPMQSPPTLFLSLEEVLALANGTTASELQAEA